MINGEITCGYLWKKWEKRDPGLDQVVQTQEKIKNYNKNDWQEMAIDARRVVNEIFLLIKDDVDIKDPRSKEVYEDFLNHIRKYFFEPNQYYINRLENGLAFDEEYKRFFNKFGDGISQKLLELIKHY